MCAPICANWFGGTYYMVINFGTMWRIVVHIYMSHIVPFGAKLNVAKCGARFFLYLITTLSQISIQTLNET